MSDAYEAGKKARRDGLGMDANPYFEAQGLHAIRRYTDEKAGCEWACGFRDEADAIYVAKHGRVLGVSDMPAKRRRRWRAA